MNKDTARYCSVLCPDGGSCILQYSHTGEHYSTQEMILDMQNPDRHEVKRLRKDLAEALAACAEMRAALLDWHGPPNPEHSVEHCPTCALLSCTDLGRGWASPEDTAQMVGALQMVESDGEFDSLHEVTRKFVVDVLALLKAEVETAKAWQGAAVLRNYDAVRILTEEIGTPGPENIDETARRAVMVIRAHKRALAAGPAALRKHSLVGQRLHRIVEAAQEAAMKGKS